MKRSAAVSVGIILTMLLLCMILFRFLIVAGEGAPGVPFVELPSIGSAVGEEVQIPI